MKTIRREFSAKFKSKVAFEVFNERSSLHELASKYELNVNQITAWNKELFGKYFKYLV